MNKFTLMLINKGWKVNEALGRWNITPHTWQQMRKREKDLNKLNDMILGLEDKSGN